MRTRKTTRRMGTPTDPEPPSRATLAGPVRRVNITLPEVQHDELLSQEANVSGVIRELLDDYLSGRSIVLKVDEQTRQLYDEVMSSTGFGDAELAAALTTALESLLEKKMEDLKALQASLKR